jgi:transposase
MSHKADCRTWRGQGWAGGARNGRFIRWTPSWAFGPLRMPLLLHWGMKVTDPRAWLADIMRRINDYPASRLHELLPRTWCKPGQHTAAAA